MNDSECIAFLQWCLPQLRMRWAGFRKVRKQVCKRIGRRIVELELFDLPAYRDYLDRHPDEWSVLDSICRVTISRFYRDRGVFDYIRHEILPGLASSDKKTIHCWCAGCASGEEAYTVKMLWDTILAKDSMPLPRLHITATDSDPHLLERARRSRYSASAIKDMPQELINSCFEESGREYAIREKCKQGIDFIEQDIRTDVPDGRFEIIFCRNLVFTYFEESLQEEIIKEISSKLTPGGYLIIGIHEHIPRSENETFLPSHAPCIYRKRD